MMTVRTLALMVACLASSACAASNRVAVLSSAAVHTDASTASFNGAGLAELAMSALGVSTGELETVTANIVDAKDSISAKSAAFADPYHPVQAYTQILVDAHDVDVLSSLSSSATSQKSFDLDSGDVVDVATTIAKELAATDAAVTKCVGTSAACSALAHDDVETAQVAAVVAAYPSLKESDALTQEIALAQQLIAELEAKSVGSGKAFFVASFSSTASLGDEAQKALTATIQKLVNAVDTAYSGSYGVQVVASTASTTTKVATRMLEAQVTSGSSSSADSSSSSSSSGSSTNSSSNSTSSSNWTESQIAEYQIILWTSVILVAALAMIIVAMTDMNSHHDSLLYAKFTTTASRKFD